MIAEVRTHKGVRVASTAEGERVQYTLSRQDRDLGNFVRFIPFELQPFELEKLSLVMGDFFGMEVSHV